MGSLHRIVSSEVDEWATSAPLTSTWLQILEQPPRLMICWLLLQSEQSAVDIQTILGFKQLAMSNDLETLVGAGMLTTRHKNDEICYRLADKRLRPLLQALKHFGASPKNPFEQTTLAEAQWESLNTANLKFVN